MEQTAPPRPDRASLSIVARGAGIVVALFGGLNLLALFLMHVDGEEISREEFLFNIVSIALMLGGGLGLFAKRRWGWPPVFLIGVLAVGLGVWTLLQPPDVAFPGSQVIAFVVLVVPGGLLLAALLSPRTLLWLRHR